MMDPIRLAAAFPIAATLLPLVRTGRGWVRIWDFPRPQIAALAAVVTALSARYRRASTVDSAVRAVLAGCALYQAAKIWRYTPLYPKQVVAGSRNADREVSLLIANVYLYNRQVPRVVELIREMNPDIVCLVETDAWWAAGLSQLHADYPHRSMCPLPNSYGMMLFSRFPFLTIETRYIVEPDIPSMHARFRLRSGEVVTLHCLHPRPPLPGTSSYGRDAELVLVGNEVANDPTPTIVAGDLNDVAWSYTTTLFQQISQTLDPRVGRGMFNSFHADYAWLRYPLDHVFHSEQFKVVELRRLRHVGSDHFPIFVRLVLSNDAPMQQDPPPMTESAAEEAEEMLDDARRELSH
jgi:endonuclease/exonuclease/phosphatase (EEP) superfamily protein YafD